MFLNDLELFKKQGYNYLEFMFILKSFVLLIPSSQSFLERKFSQLSWKKFALPAKVDPSETSAIPGGGIAKSLLEDCSGRVGGYANKKFFELRQRLPISSDAELEHGSYDHADHRPSFSKYESELLKKDEEPVGILSVLMTGVTIFTYCMDVASSAVLCYWLFDVRRWWWWMSVTPLIISLLIVNAFSMRWYIHDSQENKEHLLHASPGHWVMRAAFHVILLGPLIRYSELFLYGLHTCDRKDPNNRIPLNAPTTRAQAVNLVSALVELSLAQSAYHRARRRATPLKQNMTRIGTAAQFFSHCCVIASRVMALAAFASIYGHWIFLFVGIHWCLMTAWLMCLRTSFCVSSTGQPRPLEEFIFNIVVGVIYVFCFVNVKDEPTRWKYATYYFIIWVENLVLILLWYLRADPDLWFRIPLLNAVILSLAVAAIMIQTRNSKRLAGKQSVDPTAKCNGASLNENIKESKRNQNRICKQKLQGNKKENDLRDKGKKGKDIVSDKTSATKNICSNSTIRSSVRLIENKSNLQKLKIDESEKIKKVLNSKRNIKVDKENNLSEYKISVPNPSKELKTNINSIRKITNNFPLKTISDNAVSHVPIWAVDKNLPKKQTEKRASDIYNIEKDEDLMNELSPVKKKKKTAVKKPQVIRNKIFSKKTLSSLTSHKNVFLSTKEAKPARQLKCEGWNMIKTNPAEPTLHTVDKHEILGTASILKSTDPVLESVDSIMESAIKNTGIPTATNEIVIESNTKTQEKGEKYVEDCITDCYSSFVNIDTSDISFGKSVAKCLDKSVNNNMTPDKQSNQSVVKMNHYVEDCIDECYASFMNMDTSLRESVEKDKTKVSRIDMTPDKTNSKNVKMSKNSPGRQIFLIPKMTSTPENGDNPVIQTVKHQSKNCGLLLSEMSAIPCTVSRNIQLELSEIEISPIKASLNNQETSLYESPSEENKNSKAEKLDELIESLNQHFSELENMELCFE
ncbi:XK-related protein 6 like protein [Argiope bruennichi]|uniref:XK-related protein n=1 Tax=Argiope bruennichi TaxID=94029 RepID=A0A8T0E8Z4_ARGBR|nr:XK-related protein 6 like protein [Argiope bruennichi]